MTPAIPPAWKHQIEAFRFVRGLWSRKQNGVMLDMVMGTGKTRPAIELAVDDGVKEMLVACPLRVIPVWEQQLARYAPGYFHVLALDDRMDWSVRRKHQEAMRILSWGRERHKPVAILINYDSARLAPFGGWAAGRLWDLVIADECVPADSPIDTPNGKIAIEQLKEGDSIYGYDHKAKRIVRTRVTATFRRQTFSPLLTIHGAQMTPEHPVWTTNRGYVPARLLCAADEVLLAQTQPQNPSADLPALPQRLLGKPENQTILQQGLPIQGHIRDARSAFTISAQYAPDGFPISKWTARLITLGRFANGTTGKTPS